MDQNNTISNIPAPGKLGGWLIVIAVAMIITCFRLVNAIVIYVQSLSESFTPDVRAFIIFNIIFLIFSLISLVYLLVIMYMRKKSFVKLMIGFVIIVILVNILTYFLFKSLSEDMKQLLLMRIITISIAGIAFIAYLKNSERVRTTFVK